LAPFLAFWLAILVLVWLGKLPSRYVVAPYLWGLFAGSVVLMVGGWLDDKYNLRPRVQFVFPLLAVVSVLAVGIGINFVTNPLNWIPAFAGMTKEGLWHLDRWQWEIIINGNYLGQFVLIADVFTVIWLLGMSYTTKFLDGLDGLVSGLCVISAFIIFALSLSAKTYQPDVALLAIILAGAMLGFLFWNTYPARIFLGEGGSVWAGFMMGVLAIISGGKVATALLVMGVPILDAAWVIVRRRFFEKRSVTSADDKHLHFRLLTAGFSHRRAVFMLWGISALFGVSSLFLQTRGKVYALVILAAVMALLALWVTRRSKLSLS
jgi:UDP-GlcNAc:undecaprenyl-phosphate GlcNAc-1-phosphate transferase